MTIRDLLLLLVLLSTTAWAEDPTALLKQHGWGVERQKASVQLELPDKFGGLPFFHYQKASQAIGLDLTPGSGKTVTLHQYLLTERSRQEKYALYAHVALLKGRVIGAWLSTEAPIAPGIGALNDKEFGHGF